MTLREAAQQALEALLRVQPQVRGAIPVQDVEEALNALRAALTQQNEWQGLTDVEIAKMPWDDMFVFARAIEAALKEKNT